MVLYFFEIVTEGSRSYHMEAKCLCYALYLECVCKRRVRGRKRREHLGVFMEVRGQCLGVSSRPSAFELGHQTCIDKASIP